MESKPEEYGGRAKEAAGDVTDDDELKTEGKIDKAAAKVKNTANDVIDKVKNTAKDTSRRH